MAALTQVSPHRCGTTTHTTPLDLSVVAPILTTTVAEIEQRTGMAGGPELVQIQVEDEQGLLTRFWVNVRINRRGQPVLTVSTARGDDTVRKSVTGTKKRL